MVLKVPALPSASHTQALLCTGPTYRCYLVPPCPKYPCFWGADRFGENERVTSSRVQRQIRPHHVSIPGSLLAQPPSGPPLSPAITPAAPHPAFLQPPIFMKGRPSMRDHEVQGVASGVTSFKRSFLPSLHYHRSLSLAHKVETLRKSSHPATKSRYESPT